MARVLFLTQVLPYPLDTGAKVRAYYVLRHLAQQHAITLVSFVRDEDRAEHVAHLREVCAAVHCVPMHRSRGRTLSASVRATLQGKPIVIVRDEVPEMLTLLRDLAGMGFDVIHADQTSMVQYALHAAALPPQSGEGRGGVPASQTPQQDGRPRLVLDAHNALFKVVARMAAQTSNLLKARLLHWEADKLATYERDAYAAFDRVVFVTAEDRADFGIPGATVIPICGDPLATPPVTRHAHPRRVTFVGALHWPPNAEGVRWFLNAVWPTVRAAVPDAILTVVGAHPPADLLAAAGPAQGIQVTGYVADLTPLLAESAAFIVPLWAGGGMRVKIVDAWTWGVPVVSTPIGAEGIAYTPDHDLLLAADPAAFAAAVLRLLQEPSLGDGLVAAGRATVARHYDWRAVYAAWDGVYA